MDGAPAKEVRVPNDPATKQVVFLASHLSQATVSFDVWLNQQLKVPTVSSHSPAPVPMEPSYVIVEIPVGSAPVNDHV
jgi:hypothetical protein